MTAQTSLDRTEHDGDEIRRMTPLLVVIYLSIPRLVDEELNLSSYQIRALSKSYSFLSSICRKLYAVLCKV
jgi:hypothetical protein